MVHPPRPPPVLRTFLRLRGTRLGTSWTLGWFFFFWADGPWGYLHAWVGEGGVPGYVLEILGYKEQYVTRLLFGYQKSKVKARAFDESG